MERGRAGHPIGRLTKQRKIMKISTKRVVDITLSIIALTLIAPILLIVALAIKLEEPGPVLFIQQRTGKDGELFEIYKFRSMAVTTTQKCYCEEKTWQNGVPDDFVFKAASDNNSNVTKVGKFIRKTSIDELPQLINVLKGNMSLVGPRPEVPAITDYYNQTQRQRLQVKPGITGWAQVHGRSDITNGEKMTLDNYYVKHHSFTMDLLIFFKTIKVIITTKGAV